MITINGEVHEVSELRLTDYLQARSMPKQRIAVECNGEILPKAQYDETVLRDGDKVEIVQFVGGG